MPAPVGPSSEFHYGCGDPRSYAERLEDLHRIYEQVGQINCRQTETAVRVQLLRQLQQRRTGRDDLVQFDVVTDPRGDEVLVVRDELLIRASVLRESRFQRLLEMNGLQVLEERLEGRLVRLSAPDSRGTALIDLAGSLRSRSIATSPNYVTPMGPVMKGLGGPEPSAAGEVPTRPPAGDGTPVRVAVLDTGIAEAERSDGWLTGLATPDNIDPLDVLPTAPDGYLDFGAGHGTFVAGVVQQVAPGADLSVYRALDSDGIGSQVEVAEMMVRAARDGAQILNLSLGLETLDDQPPLAFEVALEIISEISAETGREIMVIAAAGNFGRSRPVWPAAFCGVVAVGGLTQRLAPARWSSRGPWVTCSTLGEGVWSTYVEGRESPLIDPTPDEFHDPAWALWTGTSFAAPQVAGAVARLGQEQGLSPRHALARLLDGRPEVPDYGRSVRILPEV